MHFQEEAQAWLTQGLRRQLVLLSLHQPLTARQIGQRTGLSLDSCMHVLRELKVYRFVNCLTPSARRSRVYGLTRLGVDTRELLGRRKALRLPDYETSEQGDCVLYGWVTFRHRTTVLLTLKGPMQPAEIARIAGRAERDNPFEPSRLRMSANNCRDVIKLFLRRGLVKEVHLRGRGYTRFQLTKLGIELQRLTRRAGERHRIRT